MVNNIKEANYQVSEKDSEIERLKADFKEQLAKKQEEITNLSGTIKVKDEYIKELEEQNDQFSGELEKIGYDTFI
jgi:chromosome segregation ATPase